MHRMDPRSMSMRSYTGGGARGVIQKIDDDHNMQEAEGGFLKGEKRRRIERVQNYGFTSVPLPADSDGKNGPEAYYGFMGADRSHPYIAAIDDPRHRPYGLKEGENAQYDDRGQMTYLAREGAYLLSTRTEASLRHVEKDKQPRKQGNSQAGAPQQSQPAQEYDHKGKSNSEINAKKDRVEIVVKGEILAVVVGGNVYLGGDPDRAQFGRVETDKGTSVNVFAKIG